MFELMTRLFPICRSITGNGVRETLKIISEHIQLEIHEVETGKKVFDWIIPMEWNINDAYIKNEKGEKIIDFKKSNLHILNYSIPIKKKIKIDELKKHLHTIPKQPNDIPYKTSYYNEQWGFCLSHNQFSKLNDEYYEVFIDSELKNGSLTYGEYFIEGKSKKEILLTCYVCHPSLCNDNLSGVVISTALAEILTKNKGELNYSYRFLFIPETIGAITWLSINEQNLEKIKHGLVLTCLGDEGNFTYKRTRDGDNEIDNIIEKKLNDSNQKFTIKNFFPTGSDERQFCSPEFNLPIGSLTRSMYGEFKEYHTSADNLSFVSSDGLKKSFETLVEIILELENNFDKFKNKKNRENRENNNNQIIYLNLNPKCEPQLGKRGLYHSIGGPKDGISSNIEGFLWLLNFSDGNYTLTEIAEKSQISENKLIKYAEILIKKKLLKKI